MIIINNTKKRNTNIVGKKQYAFRRGENEVLEKSSFQFSLLLLLLPSSITLVKHTHTLFLPPSLSPSLPLLRHLIIIASTQIFNEEKIYIGSKRGDRIKYLIRGRARDVIVVTLKKRERKRERRKERVVSHLCCLLSNAKNRLLIRASVVKYNFER